MTSLQQLTSRPKIYMEAAVIDGMINAAIADLNAGHRREACERLAVLDEVVIDNPIRCNLIGLILLGSTAFAEALAWFDQALALNPSFPDGLRNRAVALHKLGHLQDALAAYATAAKFSFADAALFYNQGNILRSLGRVDEAIAAYDKALKIKPAYPEALRAGGLVLFDLHHYDVALEFFDEALRLDPNYTDALLDRGHLLLAQKRFEAALESYNVALSRQPQNADLLNNRGVVLNELDRLPEALAALDEAIAVRPDFATPHFNRGNVLLQLRRPDEALASFDRALILKPDYSDAMCSRAVALKELGRFEQAMQTFDAALQRDPQSAHAKNNKGALLLLRGDFEAGLDLYEYRWIAGQTPKQSLKLPIPEWQGEPAEGARIVVFDEQGLGDTIQLSRYLPLLAAQGADVTFFCRPKMQRLLQPLAARVRIVSTLPEQESFEFQIALSSLPRAFKTRLHTIPAVPRYLSAEPALVETWGKRIGRGGFKIGLCWQGNPNPKADISRSIPLDAFAPLAGIAGLRLIAIQNRDGLDQLKTTSFGSRIENLGIECDQGEDAFVDTAAIMQNLDLIITCDTSIAHLAGALGCPVWVLLKKVPDWRWHLEREDSPWYPSMRLFRQSERGEWAGVVARIASALADLRMAA